MSASWLRRRRLGRLGFCVTGSLAVWRHIVVRLDDRAHIISVHDRAEFNGQLWISMDFVDGLDAGSCSPADQVVRIVTAVASALDYVHNQGLLHRDVKPANIMLTHLDDGDEQPSLPADFGIARKVDDALSGSQRGIACRRTAPKHCTNMATEDCAPVAVCRGRQYGNPTVAQP